MANNYLKRTARILLIIIGVILLAALIYVIYVFAQYSRIDDKIRLEVKNNSGGYVSVEEDYMITTYNIGFGAYDTDFSFFMDSGEMKDGKKVRGKYAKARNKEIVRKNSQGALNQINLLGINDFIFVQELDEKGDRSRNFNQRQYFEINLSDYGSIYAENFHSAYLFYPFNDPIGQNNSGIMTLSKYRIADSMRRSLPVDGGFNKFFDLDRCISVSRLNVGGLNKQLVLINVHMSAYDEGGKIRAKQMDMLSAILAEEQGKGNYVIAGGDFNHDLSDTPGNFATQQKKPGWVAAFDFAKLPQGYLVAKANNADLVATCRSTDLPFESGVNYQVIIDGFLVSDNISVGEVQNIDTQYYFSDHNPVTMTFSLKGAKR